MTGAVRRGWRAAALGCAGAIALFAATGVSRADDFWQGGTSTDWFDAANWSAGSVPTAADTEHFDSTATSLTISLANTTDGRVGALVFDATAPAFTFEIGSGGSAPSFLTITGAGITDNGANAPTFTLVDAGFGETQLNFGDHAVNGLAAPTAGDAIINSDGAVVTFNEHASAGNAVITQTGASGLNFLQNSSAGNATMNGFIQFGDSADGGNATINDIVQLNMSGTSSLGNATVTTNSGSINFFDNANGGNATVDLGSGASLNLQFLTASGISLGSLTGSGAVNLDSKSLTVGAALGASDVAEFGGTIGGTGGSLLKDGDGTWILDNTPGAYSYTHATTVNGGTLQVDGDISSSSGISTNGSVTITGSGTLPYADINSGSTLAPGTTSSVGTINLASDLHFHESSIFLVDVVGSDADRATVAGAVTISAATTLQFAPDLAVAGTYTILSATGGITGTFGTVDFGSGFGSLNASVIYQTNAILLQLDEPPPPTFNWTGASSNDWDDAANWSDTKPGSGQTGVFGATGDQTINFTADATTTVGGLQFDVDADAFDFELNPGSGAGTRLVLDGDGIVDNSAFFQIIDVITSDAAHPSELDFTNSASASDASIGFDGPLAIIRFQGNSTADISEIVPLSPDAVSEIHFEDSSHAGNALIFANSLYVSGTASLDTAGIEIGENGLMQLGGASDGAQAEVFLGDGSVLDITGHDPGTVGLGSVDGSGTIELGDHELSLDMCGCSPHFFDGTIEDFAAGTHGAIGVGGDGIWILGSAGTYTYTGQTTVYGAEIEVDGDISSSSGVAVQEGVLSGYGTVPSTTVHAGGTFSPGGEFIDTLTVHGDLTLLSGAFFEADIDDFPSSDLADVSGAVALNGELDIFLDPFSTFTAGMHYTLIQGASIGGDFSSMVVYGSLDAGLGIDRGVIGDTYVVQIADALTWKINPGSTAFGTGANWFGGVVPSFGDAAVFGTSSVTTIDLANGVILGSMTFAGDAFTFNLAGSNEGYAFTGAGIVNNASGPQQFNLTGSGATLDFDGAASAGDTHFDISAPGAAIRFRATASADTAVFDASGAGSYIAFNDSTSAASADITLGAGATLIFFGASDGGSATVETVAGALVDLQPHDAGTITLGSISGGGGIHLGANTLSLGALDTDMSIGGAIDGSGGLTKTGAGTLTLTGANTYTGTTTISDGELALGTGGSIDGDVLDDGVLRFDRSDDFTFAHAISGGGTVRISGSGVTTLSGSNGYTGGTYVETGATLSVLADDNIGPGSLTFFPNSALVFGAGGTYTHDALFATGAPVFDTAGNTVTYSGQLSGGGDLTVIGGGTLILTNTTNSYSGGTFVQDGATVEVDADSELGDTAGGVTLGDGTSAGTLKFDASFDLDGGRSFTVEAGGGAIDTNSFDTTLAQAIAGSGDLEKRGTGTLFLTGTGGYGGTLNVAGGTLDISGIYASAAVGVNGGVLTGIGEVGSVHIASGGTLQENTPGNELTVDNALTFDSGSTFEVTVDGASPGGIIANGAVTLAGALVVNVTPDIYTAGVPYALISSASAVSGTFDEGETFNGSFGHFVTHVTYNDHGNGVFLTLSEAPFNWAANPPGIANWTDSASWDAGLVPGSGDTAAFGATTNANPIVSSGTVVNLAEMDFLAGAPAYTIVVDGSGGDASFTLDGGAGIVDSSSQALTIVAQGDVAGVGQVYLLAGSLGDAHVRVHDGGSLTLDAASSAGNADIAMDGGSLQFLGTVDASTASLKLDGGSVSVATASALTIGSLEGGGGTIDLSADLIIANGGSKSYGGSITGAHSVTLQSFTLILTASMAYTGATNVLGGGEIDLGDTTGGHDGNLAGDVALSSGGNLKFNWAAAHEFGGVFSGQGTVLVNGAGKVTLTGDSAAFDGNTFVFSGATLQLGNGGTSGMIAHSIFGDVDATLILDHGVGGQFELPGTVGLGTVHQVGAAYVAFTSDLIVNTSLIIDSATQVRIGNGGTTGTLTGNVADNGLLVFDRSDTLTYAGNITGAGGVQIGLNGAGTITFSGTSNSYSGSTQIESGATLKAGAANVFSANSRFVLCDCATLDLADHSQTIGGLTGGGHVLLGSAATTTLTFAGNAADYFGGVISGAGKVTLIGTDTVVFTNANTYGGVTTIGSDVTLVLGDDPFNPVQGSVAGDIVDNGAIALELSGTTNIAGAISGSGGLFKLEDGSVTTLGGANTYSGATDIQAGTLRATSSSSFSANSRFIVEDIFGNSILDLNGHDSTIAGLGGDGAVLLSAHLTTGTSGASDQFDGTFTGGGGLTEAAGGTLVLTGNYNDIGATTVNGVLSFAGTGAHAPNGGVTVSLGGELIGAADTLTLSFVTGPGDFSVEGGRTIITDVVDGTLSHVTVQSNGILQISDGPSGANLESNVLLQDSASQLVFARFGSISYDGVISGSGSVTQSGLSQLLFRNNNTYSGTTTIASGSLQVGQNGTTGSIGAGDIVDNGDLTFSRSNALTVANKISGSGTFTQNGDGVLTLSNAANSYSGGTSILDGVLSVATDSALGAASGAVLLNSGTLRFSNAVISSRNYSIFNNATFDVRADSQIGGNITGSGRLTKTGSAVLELLGSGNNWTGGTTISAGTLRIGSAGTIAGNVVDNATLDFATNQSVFFGDQISGSGAVTVTGGTVFLTNTNTYTGGTTVSATLEIGNNGTTGSIVGNIANNGTLSFFRSDAVAFGGNISGTGILNKLAGGTLTLTGTNTYSGDTNITGTLIASGGAAIGDASVVTIFAGATLNLATSETVGAISSNGGTAAIALNANTLTLAGSFLTHWFGQMTGTGGLTLVNNGNTHVLLMGGTNAYSGATHIDSGEISADAANGFSPFSAVTVASGATLDLNGYNETIGSLAGAGAVMLTTVNGGNGVLTTNGDNSATLFSGAFSGVGGLTKVGTGTLTLTGDSSFTGSTTVTGGTLQLGNGGTTGSLTGDVADNGSLVFDRSDNITFAGVISGSGALSQAGGGNLILSAISGLSGATHVDSGTLSVNGSIAGSTVTVDGGGTLGGTGTVGATTVASGGTLAPGNSIGTLHIGGDLTLALGSHYVVEVSSAAADEALVGGAVFLSGDLTLVSSGALAVGHFTLINSTAALSGVFSAINLSGAFTGLTANITYDSHNVFLDLVPESFQWQANPGSGDWNTGANWVPGTVPTGVNNTIFDASTVTTVAVNQAAATNSMIFDAGAPGYTFDIAGTAAGDASLTVNGGINDASSNRPSFSVSGSGGHSGTLTFTDLTSGDAMLTVNAQGTIAFTGTADGAGSQIHVNTGGTLTIAGVSDGGASIGSIEGVGGTVDLGAKTLTVGGLNTTTLFTGTIIGAGALTKTGSGTLILTGASTYTGGTTISQGTLQIGLGGALGSLAGNVVDNATLAFDRSDSFIFAGAISGSGSVQQSGSGTAILTGANIYSGGTTISSGVLQIGNGGSAGSLSGNVADNGALAFSRSDPVAFAGLIGGTGSVRQIGSGQLTLTNAANSYSGGTFITGGTLAIDADGELGSASGLVTLDGGTLHFIGNIIAPATRDFSLGSNGGTFDTSNSPSINGDISGAGGLTVTGSFGLNGTNTYTGGTVVVSGGGLAIGQGGTTGSIVGDVVIGVSASTLTLGFQRSDDITFSGNVSGLGSVDQNGSGVLTLTGNNTQAGGTAISQGTLAVGADANLGALGADLGFVGSGPGTLRFLASFNTARAIDVACCGTAIFDTNGFSATLSGVISGVKAVVKTGAGNLILSNSETYTGTTSVNGGTLSVNGSIASSTVTVNSGGTLGGTGTVGATTVASGGTLAPGNSIGTLHIGGDLTLALGSHYVVEVSSAAADEALVGGAVFISGDLTLVASGALAVGHYTLINATGALSGTFSSIALSGAFTGFAANVTYDGHDVFLDVVLQGFLWQANPGSGDWNTGANWLPGTVPTGTDNTIFDASTVTTVTVNQAAATNRMIFNAGAPGYTFDIAGTAGGDASLTVNGGIDDSSSNKLNFVVSGAGGHGGTLTFNGFTSGDAILTANASGTVAFTGSADGGASQAIVNGGTLTIAGLSNGGMSVGSLAGTGGTVDLGANTLSAGGLNASTNFGGTITGSGALTKTGTGTLSLTGASSYTGGTTIAQGTLQIGNGGTSGSIAGDVVDNGVLAFNRSDALTFAGAVSGSGSVQQTGSGTTTLTGANTYGGGTVITAGTLRIGNGGTSGSLTGAVADNGTLAFNRSDTVAFSGTISGSGALVQAGTGVTALTADSTYSGGTLISAGALALGDGSSATGSVAGGIVDNATLSSNHSGAFTLANLVSGSGAFVQAGGTTIFTNDNSYAGGTTIAAGTLQLGNGGTSGSFQGAVADNGTLAFNRSDTITFGPASGGGAPGSQFGGVISGTGNVVQAGTGTTILTAANTYSGGTTITAGTLQLGDGGAVGSILGGVVDNGTLAVKHSDTLIIAGAISGNGAFVQKGSGTTVLTGTNSYTGPTTIATGTLQIGNGGATGTVAGAIADNGTLIVDRAGVLTLGGVISGSGSLVKSGSGTLTLAALDTYTGPTTVNAGTLSVDGSISGSTVTVNSGATLGGNGTVGTTTVAGGGTLAAGDSIGTLHVAGDLTLASGSHLVAEIGPAASDEVLASGAVLLGGDLTLAATGGSYNAGQYTLINSGGALSGTFSSLSVAGSFGGYDVSLLYDAHDVILVLDLNGVRWSANPGSQDWNTGANWLIGTVPTASDKAFFGASTVTTIDVNQATSIAGMNFGAGAPAYTFNVAGTAAGNASLTVGGTGINDGSGNRPAFVVGGAAGNTGALTFASASSGDAMLTVGPLGTVVFTGAANGGTSQAVINAGGTLSIAGLSNGGMAIGSIEGGGTIQLGTNTLTEGGLNSSTLFSGAILGSGGLVKTGSGTLTLTGANGYSGGTTIAAGTLQLGNGGTTGAIAGDVVDNGALAFNRSDAVTFAGAISGTGDVQQAGSGTTILTGANSYTGTTIITAGTLQVGTGGTAGAIESTAAVNDNGALVYDVANDRTLAAAITGTGSLALTGPATITLTGANDYAGGTTISSGRLQLGNGGFSGAITGAVNDNGVLAFNRADLLIFDGVVSGSGALQQNGLGITALTAANTYTGGTTVSFGVLVLGFNGTSGSIAGNVLDNAQFAIFRSDVYTFGGVISGSGQFLDAGTGTAILTADNTYSGGTSILPGAGTLQIGNGGTTGSIVGDVADEGIFAIDRSDTVTFGGTISGGGAFAQTGAGKTILTAANSYSGGTTIASGTLQLGNGGATGSIQGDVTDNGTLTFDRSDILAITGVISGSGAVQQIGGGTTVLLGANTYTGGTTIAAGILQIGNGNTTGSIVGNVADNGLLVIARSDAFAFAGAITGTGSLTQGGSGVTTLSGASTYSGTTLVDAGTLQAGAVGAFSASSAHTVSLIATLDLNGFNETIGSLAGAGLVTLGSATLTAGGDNSSTLFSGAIAGGGGLIKAGTGTFVLTGANSYAGGTTISGGTLELGNGTPSGSILGNIVDNGTLSLHRSDNVLFSATISGSGALVQKGPGMTVLTATNTYSGGTTIQGGMLILGNGGTVGSIVGNVADNAAFAFNRTDNLTFAGVISGTGSVTKYNGNTLILTANNSYSGGTTIAGGTLQLGNGGAGGAIVGDVADNGTLTIDRSDTLTLAGVISGAGGLNQIGTGMTVLSGISPYSGPTFVTAGILDVNGSIANSAVVLNGGTLKGNGTIGSLTVLGGSNVSPGNSIGTLNVAGSIGFAAGTTYAVEINAAGLSDRINASGQAILAGGTVVVTAAPGNYALVTTYRIIDAAGGVSGAFSSVTVDLPFFDASLLYGMSNVDLVLRAKTVDFTNLGLTPNELAAGGGVNAGTFNSDLYKAFLNQPSTAFIPAALDALSGEIHPTMRTALLEDSRNIRQAILDRLRQSNSGAMGLRGQNDARPLTDSVTMWLRVFSNWGQADTDHNAGTAERNYSGIVAGIDTSVVGALRLGFAGGYSHSDVTVTSRASKARAGGGHIAAYAGWNDGALALRAGAEYAWGNATVTRTVQFPGFLNNTSDVERQHSTQAFAEAGYALTMDPIALEPFAGFAWVNASTGAFHETGGIAALAGNSTGNAVTYSNLGLRLATAPMGSDAFAITPRLTLAWQHAFGAVLPGQSVTFQSTNQSFLVLGVPLDRDALATQLGVDIQLTPAGHLGLGYEGVLSSRVRSHAIRADLSWTF
ncbi:MAG TPA: autotransporter-associated beta strand repeat-containing protein [Rhizomicrobium sp.]